MKKFALLGYPIQHSKSPILFKAAYGHRADLLYQLIEAPSIDEAMQDFKHYHLRGANITAPFKTSVLAFADQLSDDVRLIGACNTIVHYQNLLCAYNTDYLSVSGALTDFKIDPKHQHCLVLGAGGAGRAAAYALVKAGAQVTIANRTLATARTFADHIDAHAIALNDMQRNITKASIIVNTLYPSIDCVDEAWLTAGQVVMNASYTGSTLSAKATRQGCTFIDGRYWLLHQAIAAFELFTALPPDVKAMRNILDI